MLPDDTRFITNEASLRALHPQPMLRATGKVLRTLDTYCRRIISLSPFCVVATQGPNGADVSPRGDPAGFVRVLDDLTLLIPDRVGNNRLDTTTNLLVNPRIGLLFLVPGMNETLRINGTARITAAVGAERGQQSHAEGWHYRHGRGSAASLRQGIGAISALGWESAYRSVDPAQLRPDAARAG
jgi:predicted pyridoxine 5'-phosphate oxidase superfamily flavin-nucleotide-binding protein